MTAKGEVPVRPGVAQFLDDALAEGAPVAVVAATASVPEDGLVSSAMLNLGPNRCVCVCVCVRERERDGCRGQGWRVVQAGQGRCRREAGGGIGLLWRERRPAALGLGLMRGLHACMPACLSHPDAAGPSS